MRKALILMLLVLISLQVVSAAGTSFDTAEQITTGTITGGAVTETTPNYYKIELKPGERLSIIGTFESYPEKVNVYASLALYDSSRKEVVEKTGLLKELVTVKTGYVASQSQSGIFYIKVDNPHSGWSIKSYSLQLSLENNTDLSSGTDAPDIFDQAVLVSAGSYPNCCWLSTDSQSGEDLKDTYRISLKRNNKLTAKVTPGVNENNEPAEIDVSIYDANRELQTEESALNAGMIVTAEYISPEDQTIYIVASRNSYDAGGPYSLDINVEGGQGVVGCTPLTMKCSDKGEVQVCTIDGKNWETGMKCEYGCQQSGTVAACKDQYGGTTLPSGSYPTSPGAAGLGAFFLGIFLVYIVVMLVIIIALYIYSSLALMTIAKKTDTEPAWLAWVPILNLLLMAKIGRVPLWTVLLAFIPFVNIFVMVWWWMKIAEARGKPTWLGILILVPIVGILVPGYIAWSK